MIYNDSLIINYNLKHFLLIKFYINASSEEARSAPSKDFWW